jgi:hypothetical protein
MGCEESVLQSFLTTSMFSGCRTVAIKGQQKRSAGDLRLDAYGEEPKTETVDKDDRVRFGQLTLRSPAFRDPQEVAMYCRIISSTSCVTRRRRWI